MSGGGGPCDGSGWSSMGGKAGGEGGRSVRASNRATPEPRRDRMRGRGLGRSFRSSACDESQRSWGEPLAERPYLSPPMSGRGEGRHHCLGAHNLPARRGAKIILPGLRRIRSWWRHKQNEESRRDRTSVLEAFLGRRILPVSSDRCGTCRELGETIGEPCHFWVGG